MISALPRGPLKEGDEVLICYWDGTNLYSLALNRATGFERVIRGDLSIVSRFVNTYTISNIDNSVSLTSGDFNVVILGNILALNDEQDPTSFSILETDFQPWSSDVILAGVPYFLSYSGNPVLYLLRGELRVLSIMFIPLVYYYGCSTLSIKKNESAADSIRIAYCSLNPNLNVCKTNNLYISAWTNPEDCQDGFMYEYCIRGLTCVANCKTTCNNSQICVWSGSDYSCSNNPNPSPNNNGGSGGTSNYTYTIIAVIIVTIAIFSVLYLTYEYS